MAGLVVGLRAAAPVSVDIFPGVAEVTFESDVLGAPRKFCVVVPEVRPAGPADWPVLFLLHGRGRNHRSLVDVDDVRQMLRASPFCTVLPQGDDGWYIDSPVNRRERYESYLAEVMAVAARVQRLSGSPARRAIAGWSMGGYGAVRFATRHPAEFSVVAGIIGLLDFPRPEDLPKGQNYTVPLGRFGVNQAEWTLFNPMNSADALRGKAVMIVTATDSFDRTMNERFHAGLNELDIPHEYLVLPGEHTFDVVQAALEPVLAFVARNFATRR